jgi:hypothetical protein
MFAGEFEALVRNMESHYGSKKTYIPLLGFANFLVKIARPAGTKDFKLAVFEDVDWRRHPSAEHLEMFLPHGWKPFVRVVSNKKGERVHIYSRQSHRDHELTIATFERDEAVIVRVRLDPDRLARWVNDPVRMCRSRGRLDSD